MNKDVYDRVRERVKEYHLNEEEIRAIEKAQRQLNRHATFGAIIGSGVGFLLGRYKQFKPLQIVALAGGGFLIGSQIGLVSGSLAGVRTIKELPNPERIANLVRDVQREIVAARGQHPLPRPPPPRPIQPSAQHPTETTEFAPDDNDYYSKDYARLESGFESDQGSSTNERVGWENKDATSPHPVRRSIEKQREPSAWDRIRAQHAPDDAWAKLRMEAQRNPNRNQTAKARSDVQEQSMETIEDLPRTREETEHRGGRPTRTNQWGDPID